MKEEQKGFNVIGLSNRFVHITLFVPALLLLIALKSGKAQPVRLSAAVDSANYLVGDWIQVHVSLEHAPGINILWGNPLSLDSENFEKISESKIDTIQQRDFISENKIITFITFDTGLLHIPSLTFYYQRQGATDSLSSAAITVYVATVPVDTKAAFRPIKPPFVMEKSEDQTLWYLVGGTLVLLAVAGTWFFTTRKKRKPEMAAAVETDPRLPHEKALDELNELERSQWWRQGQVKEYYIAVTKILREYIEKTFQIPALEATTRELIHALEKQQVNSTLLQQLQQILLLADLVKFAKAQPGETEHLFILEKAKSFINQTKPVEAAASKEEQPA